MKGKCCVLNEKNKDANTKPGVVFMQMKKGVKARGLYIANGVFIYEDNNRLVKSYPDTGLFILLEGSQTVCTNEKFKDCIQNGRTTKVIVFQSCNAAAQFVLGDCGNTHSWEWC